MGIAGNEWGFQVGTLPKGARDKISDVPGVTVGHCTLADGVVQTGVTALLPHQGDVFHEKVLAASYLPEDEVRGVKAVLSAAALTYVAAALQAVLQLLRLILISGNSRRRD